MVLATDYDGTLARDGVVSDTTIEALERLRASGRRLVLLTGRELTDLLQIFPRADLFDLVSIENGALLYDPTAGTQRLLAEPVPLALIDTLRSRSVQPLAVSRVILATHVGHEQAVRASIDALNLHLHLHVVLNKGSVMVLPHGIDKATGLRAVCELLRTPLETVVGIGDAENDLPLLAASGLAVATANALPQVKEIADIVTLGEDGEGVVEIVNQMIDGDLEGLAPAGT